jgi:hypothetical protein
MQQFGFMLEHQRFDPYRVSGPQANQMFLVGPVQADVGGIGNGFVGSAGHDVLLGEVTTRWLWSRASLIVESSRGTVSEYALPDQSASSRLEFLPEIVKRLGRSVRSRAMRVETQEHFRKNASACAATYCGRTAGPRSRSCTSTLLIIDLRLNRRRPTIRGGQSIAGGQPSAARRSPRSSGPHLNQPQRGGKGRATPLPPFFQG